MCGVPTNIVTSVEVTRTETGDAPCLTPFVYATAHNFQRSGVLATSKSGTHWEPRDQGLDGGLVSSLRALL